MARPVLVSLEGNIGAGKSTLAEELRRRGRTVIVESVDSWGDTLALFYEDPARWSFLLQSRILLDMRAQKDRALESSEKYVFIERSPRSAYIFVKQAEEDGNMNVTERAAYDELQSRLGWIPDQAVLLQVSDKECAKRMNLRGREAERSVPDSYVASIGERYREADLASGPVHRLDGTKSTKEIADEVERIFPM